MGRSIGEAGQLRDAQAGIEQGGDNHFLDPGAAGVSQAVGVCVGEGFALVLVSCHSSYFSKICELWAQTPARRRRAEGIENGGKFAFTGGRRTVKRVVNKRSASGYLAVQRAVNRGRRRTQLSAGGICSANINPFSPILPRVPPGLFSQACASQALSWHHRAGLSDL